MTRLRELLETLGGVRPLPEPFARSRLASFFVGMLWAALLLAVLGFAGRTAKFIYIDF